MRPEDRGKKGSLLEKEISIGALGKLYCSCPQLTVPTPLMGKLAETPCRANTQDYTSAPKRYPLLT